VVNSARALPNLKGLLGQYLMRPYNRGHVVVYINDLRRSVNRPDRVVG
jgi:hypothetical protein